MAAHRSACFVRQLFDLAQIVGRPTDRTLFYRLSRYARTPLSALFRRVAREADEDW
jgi:hypothetical protein